MFFRSRRLGLEFPRDRLRRLNRRLRIEPLEDRQLLNAAPVDIQLPLANVLEQQPAGTPVGVFTSTDPDRVNSFTYDLVPGEGDADNASFAIDARGDLLTASTFDFRTQSAYSLRVRSTDQGGLWCEKSFTVTVTPLVGRQVDLVSSSLILGATGDGSSSSPSVSTDGRYVAFDSSSSTLVADDTGWWWDVFVKDLQSGITTRVSTDSLGVQGNNHSYRPSLSADGRYVAFHSAASNLVAGDTNATDDIFVKDLASGVITQASTASSATEGNGASQAANISGDGRYVAFVSSASNLVSDDTNAAPDIFVKDRTTGITTRVSTGTSGLQANSPSATPGISADGRYVVFQSEANNLVSDDVNGHQDIFVKDRSTGVTTRVSTDSSAVSANHDSSRPSISGDGRYVVFESEAGNLVSGDTNGHRDIFVKDRVAGITTRVSIGPAAVEGNQDSSYASISADGRFVTYQSAASNLVVGDTNLGPDVFLHDMASGATIRASTGFPAAQGNGDCFASAVSGDGRYVLFASYADNLVAGDTNGGTDVFAKDLSSGAIAAVSNRNAEISAIEAGFGTYTGQPSISGDGRYVAFASNAGNLVFDDTNQAMDIFMKDLLTGVTTRVSTDSAGSQGNGGSWEPGISSDGRYVAFSSSASNLAPGDTNGVWDVFVKDMLTGVTSRVSVSSSAVQGNDDSGDPSVSNDGRYVAFSSYASTLVSDDSNYRKDVFVRDMLAEVTTRVNTSGTGFQDAGGAFEPKISADGRFVCFTSSSSNLVPGDTNQRSDIFVKDILSGVATRVSTSSASGQANNNSLYSTISGDGRYVAFVSQADNLVSGDTNKFDDVFVKDQLSGIIVRVSTDSETLQSNGASWYASISADGRYVAFSSDARNLVLGDTNASRDVFVKDLISEITTQVSTDSSNAQGNGRSYVPSISGDGRYVTFDSEAGNLHPWDTNGTLDVFRVSNFLIESGHPTVEHTSPADNATGVAVQANLMLAFSKEVQKGRGTLLIKRTSDRSLVESIDVASAAVSIGGAEVTIDPAADLDEKTSYYVVVSPGAFEDLAGNPFAGISGAIAWNFTTGDFTPPSVASFSPADGGSQVALDSQLVITFNEGVQTGSGHLYIKKASDGSTIESIDVASGAVHIVGTAVMIDRAVGMTETTGYYVEVSPGAFEDLSGHPFAGVSGEAAWNFTAGDFTPPEGWINRAGGQTSLTSLSPIRFTVVFSEPVTGFSHADVVLGGTAGATQAAVSDRGDHCTYDLVVSGMAQSGFVIVTVPVGAVADAAMNPSVACAASDNMVFYDYVGPATVGLFDPAASQFYLHDSNAAGSAEHSFGYGQPAQNWREVAGDWDGNGLDSVGLFDPATATWYLCNSLAPGYAVWSFGYGDANLTSGQGDANWVPVVGDWDGNGTDTIGLFDPVTSTWYLRNSLSAGYADLTFAFGDPNLTHGNGDANWVPIVGDWDGNRTDTIGLFDPASCSWHLRNLLSSGVADVVVAYGDPSQTRGRGVGNWQPIVGDWDGDRSAGIGFLAPESSTFMLRNALTLGVADLTFGYGEPGAGWRPLVGCWSVAPTPSAGLAGTLDAWAVDQVLTGDATTFDRAQLDVSLAAPLNSDRTY